MSNRNSLLAGGAVAGLALVAGAWLLFSSPNSSPVSGAGAATIGSLPDLLAVGDAEATQLGIKAEPAVASAVVPLGSIPAVIQPPANARVAVAAIFPGVVLRTRVVEGDSVRQGQPLADISSREVLTLGADLARAQARLGVARSAANRLSELSRDGIIAPARADEAAANLAEAEADVSEKQRILRLAGGNGGNGSYVLVAPIAGRVTRAALAAGDPVDGSSAPYVIDAANRYEVAGQLPERLVGVVRPGMEVSIEPGIGGKVTAVGSTIDPATRSASLKAEIPAAPGIVSGRATSLSLFAPAADGAVQVPAASVTRLADQDVVFVPASGGYVVRAVEVGGTNNGQTVLVSGLKAGEQVVTEGTSALKALALAQ